MREAYWAMHKSWRATERWLRRDRDRGMKVTLPVVRCLEIEEDRESGSRCEEREL